MNRTARFWKYTGNHPSGRDWVRHDPHNFGMPLILAMASWGDRLPDCPVIKPLTDNDVALIKSCLGKGTTGINPVS